MDNFYKRYKGLRRRQENSHWILNKVTKWFLIAVVLGLLIIVSGCDVLDDVGKRSVVYIPVDNTANCTDVVIEDSRGGVLGTVKAGRVGQVEASAWLLEQQDRTLLYAHTPHAMLDRILAGDTSVIPKGCDNWGTDTDRIRLSDGYDTEEFNVRLRPPDYWEEPGHWKALSLEEQVATKSFWSAQGVKLNTKTSKTEVFIK